LLVFFLFSLCVNVRGHEAQMRGRTKTTMGGCEDVMNFRGRRAPPRCATSQPNPLILNRNDTSSQRKSGLACARPKFATARTMTATVKPSLVLCFLS
jgi:hypothetical protein